MADDKVTEPEMPRLFSHCVFAFVFSRDLPQELAEEVQYLIPITTPQLAKFSIVCRFMQKKRWRGREF